MVVDCWLVVALLVVLVATGGDAVVALPIWLVVDWWCQNIASDGKCWRSEAVGERRLHLKHLKRCFTRLHLSPLRCLDCLRY